MTTRARLFDVPIDQIDPPSVNPRFNPRDLEDLIESIRTSGIIEPLICVATGNGRVRLVAGLRRLTSAKIIGLETVPALVHPHLDGMQERAMSLVENLHRRDLSPVERGQAFVDLMGDGLTQRRIASMVGVSPPIVSKGVCIATKLIPEARQACHLGEISQEQAYQLSQMTESMQRAMFLGGGRVKPSGGRQPNRRSPAENHLRDALRAFKIGDRGAALTFAEAAVKALRQGKWDAENVA